MCGIYDFSARLILPNLFRPRHLSGLFLLANFVRCPVEFSIIMIEKFNSKNAVEISELCFDENEDEKDLKRCMQLLLILIQIV